MKADLDVQVPLITLVGPPNSGKTTLFNLLSGKNYKTVNYPGSTVEYFTSRILSKYNIQAELLDSPGIVSLLPESIDEKVAVDSLYSHPKLGAPDLVITTIDSGQLSRHLLLPKQLISSEDRHEAAGVDLTLFYGRGGTASGGGGPLDRLVQSAPLGATRGRLRATEQGEGISNSYGLRRIALRTFEKPRFRRAAGPL